METAKIGRGGQMNLPKEIRTYLGLAPGHHVAFVIEGERVILQPLTKTLRDFRGSIPVDGPQDFTAVRQQVMAQKAREWAQAEDD